MFGKRIERLDALLVQPQPGVGALTRLQGQHVAPVRFGQVAIGGQHADITAALLHRQFQVAAFAGSQLELFERDQIRRQRFLGPLVKGEEIGILEGDRMLEFEQTQDDRRRPTVEVRVESVTALQRKVQLGQLGKG